MTHSPRAGSPAGGFLPDCAAALPAAPSAARLPRNVRLVNMAPSMDKAMRVIERVLALAFIFAVCLNFANVIGRYVIGRSITGADEVQIYIMVWMAFLGAAVVSSRRSHLRMDVLVQFLPKKLQAGLTFLEAALVLVLAAFTLVQSIRYTWDMASLGRMSDVGGIPMWIPHSAVAIGFGLIALVVLFKPK